MDPISVSGFVTMALGVFVPLFVAMDPVGAVPLVVGWMADMPPVERNRQLRDGLITALAVGLVFLVAGNWLLYVLGVGVPDFLVAGGLVLLVLAITDLVSGGFHEARGMASRRDFGVVPIGTPLLAGPATLTTLLVQLDRYGALATVVALLVCLLIAWSLFRRAGDLTRLFGRNGLRAASKVVSLLLAAIAIKYIREGLVLMFHLPVG
jgi:multiple antibiotic resistance protein